VSNDSENTPSASPRTPAWLKWARWLLIVATIGGGYLAWTSLRNGSVAGCGAGSGCNAVLQSRWAYWLDLPVSLPAVLVYLSLLASTILLQKRPSPDDQRGCWAAMIVLSVVVAGSAFWFVSLQVFVIQSFCKYCLVAHACGFTAALLCLANIPYATDPDTPMWSTGSGKRGVPAKAALSLVAIGLLGVAVLAAGQILVQKERNLVKVVKAGGAVAGTPAASTAGQPAEAAPASPNAHLIAPRTLSLYSNQFLVKLDEVPVMGSPDAPRVIVCLVDYTCIHCRALHPILEQMSRQSSNQLAIVCLPLSLSANCNPFIPKFNSRANPDACEYARLALAVWRAKPAAYREYDDWLFAGAEPPPVNQASNRAAQLVGPEPLAAALRDSWVSARIRTDCMIHRANWIAMDNSSMPQIVMGDAVSIGPINSLEHLQLLLERYLGFKVRSSPRP